MGGNNNGNQNLGGGGGGDFDGPYNTYGLSKSFLEGLGIQGPLYNKIFIANVSIPPVERQRRCFGLQEGRTSRWSIFSLLSSVPLLIESCLVFSSLSPPLRCRPCNSPSSAVSCWVHSPPIARLQGGRKEVETGLQVGRSHC